MTESPVDVAVIEEILKDFSDPESGRSVIQQKQVKNIEVQGNQVSLTLALSTWAAPVWNETKNAAESMLRDKLPSLESVSIELAA